MGYGVGCVSESWPLSLRRGGVLELLGVGMWRGVSVDVGFVLSMT